MRCIVVSDRLGSNKYPSLLKFDHLALAADVAKLKKILEAGLPMPTYLDLPNFNGESGQLKLFLRPLNDKERHNGWPNYVDSSRVD